MVSCHKKLYQKRIHFSYVLLHQAVELDNITTILCVVLYACHISGKMQIESMVLRRVFETVRKKITGDWKKLYTEQ